MKIEIVRWTRTKAGENYYYACNVPSNVTPEGKEDPIDGKDSNI